MFGSGTGSRFFRLRDEAYLQFPLAERYFRANLRVVPTLHVITADAATWRRLDSEAERCMLPVVFAAHYRWGESRRREVTAWRFPDASHLVHIEARKHPADFEVLDPQGVGPLLLLDSPDALCALVLRLDLFPFKEHLEAYIEVHGSLPSLPSESWPDMLMSPSRSVRLAAVASLTSP